MASQHVNDVRPRLKLLTQFKLKQLVIPGIISLANSFPVFATEIQKEYASTNVSNDQHKTDDSEVISSDIQYLALTSVKSDTYESTAKSPLDGYLAKRCSTASKTDSALIEIPQSITIIGNTEIQALAAEHVMESLSYTAGVSNNSGFNPANITPVLRGFEIWGGTLRDGLSIGGEWAMAQETFGLERVEYFKGASSILYGAQNPGGLINTISKRPDENMLNQAGFEIGQYAKKQLTLDVGGELFASENLWRFTLLQRKSDTQVDYVPNNNLYIAPSVEWNLTESTRLLILGLYQDFESANISGLPFTGTILPNPNGQFAVNRFAGERDWEAGNTRSKGVSLELSHHFQSGIKLASSARLHNNETLWRYSWGALQEDLITLKRNANERVDDNSVTAFDFNLEYGIEAKNLTHRLLVGTDYSREENSDPDGITKNIQLEPLDLYNPVYKGANYNDSFVVEGNYERHTNKGLYIQDQITWNENWRFHLGTRYAKISTKTKQNQLSSPDLFYNEFVSNVGVVYLMDNKVAPFISYSQSFEPENGITLEGPAKPSRGQQFETGVRWHLDNLSQEMLLSASVYQLTKTNVVNRDPSNPDYIIQTGEIQSTGFEFEARGKVATQLDLTAAYAYTDSKTTKSTNPDYINAQTPGVPFHQASIWLDYSFSDIFSLPLKIGAGSRYLSTKKIYYQSFKIPASTQFDARLKYEFSQWQLSLNVTNLTNQKDIGSCSWGNCNYTKLRMITANMSYYF